MNPGKELRRARRLAQLSQRQLAERAGTSQATISAYESGAKEPSISTLARLLAATGHRLEARGPGRARSASSSEMARRGRQLAEVLALAEALPARRRRALDYPQLRPLRGEGPRSRRR